MTLLCVEVLGWRPWTLPQATPGKALWCVWQPKIVTKASNMQNRIKEGEWKEETHDGIIPLDR